MAGSTYPDETRVAGRGFLRERELADRWKTSMRTLQRWRASGYGPPYVRIGGTSRYQLVDIVDYEDRHRWGEGAN